VNKTSDAANPAGRAAEEANSSAALVRILLVDDDQDLCASLKRLLRMDGFDVTSVHTAPQGTSQALAGQYDLVVLDVMLPGGDGRLVLRKIRASSDVPIVMLTARGDEGDRIAGLEAGADDYLPKPFNARELVARMRAVLKRRAPRSRFAPPFQIGDLEFHPAGRRVLQAGVQVPLTGVEFDILLLLVKSAGQVVSRDEIAEICLGRPIAPFDRSVDNHVSNLRKKLGAAYRDGERIQSLRGSGYIYTGQVVE
jgi:two-component system response regulator CpxR